MPLKNSLPLLLSTLLAWALSISASVSHATEDTEEVPLHPMELSYNASMDKGISLNGSARRSLEERDDGTWRFRTDVDSFIADIDESLIFRWENNQVIPLRYRYELSGFLIKDRKEAIDFDWDNMVVSGHHEGDRFSLDLEEGAMDPMGYQLQLSQDIKAGKREMEYRVIDKGRYDTDRFAVVDEETLNANGEEIRTLKAEKVRDSDSKRQSLMWFAPDRDNVLIRFLQVEPDGSEYELTLDDAKVNR
ncbi:DUF3108 domain-containing protein [Marinobacter sp. HL-58]|uniref:DUF3108 domain-containing protein n=1 Tax=Marinobacter sp. HL-58 TaxID=1479237 RepID=UPI0004833020|nr:DUF3108 domain-containing protein [Marinobacter sp. HL-58]KPQ01149.1 MAG: Protein of unknown function (DUF3108) [Marinobacter sp. HL-58]